MAVGSSPGLLILNVFTLTSLQQILSLLATIILGVHYIEALVRNYLEIVLAVL